MERMHIKQCSSLLLVLLVQQAPQTPPGRSETLSSDRPCCGSSDSSWKCSSPLPSICPSDHPPILASIATTHQRMPRSRAGVPSQHVSIHDRHRHHHCRHAQLQPVHERDLVACPVGQAGSHNVG